MKALRFEFTEAKHYRPTLLQSDIDLMLQVLDYYIEHHPKPRMAVEMASNIPVSYTHLTLPTNREV